MATVPAWPEEHGFERIFKHSPTTGRLVELRKPLRKATSQLRRQLESADIYRVAHKEQMCLGFYGDDRDKQYHWGYGIDSVGRFVVTDHPPSCQHECTMQFKKASLLHETPDLLSANVNHVGASIASVLRAQHQDMIYEDDCWLLPSSSMSRSQLYRTITWQCPHGRRCSLSLHSAFINLWIVHRQKSMTDQEPNSGFHGQSSHGDPDDGPDPFPSNQQYGWAYRGWDLSHLCGNWTCCNWRHVVLEPHVINMDRNKCFFNMNVQCRHIPACMVDLKKPLQDLDIPIITSEEYGSFFKDPCGVLDRDKETENDEDEGEEDQSDIDQKGEGEEESGEDEDEGEEETMGC